MRGADKIARMRRMVCAFVVRMEQRHVFAVISNIQLT